MVMSAVSGMSRVHRMAYMLMRRVPSISIINAYALRAQLTGKAVEELCFPV